MTTMSRRNLLKQCRLAAPSLSLLIIICCAQQLPQQAAAFAPTMSQPPASLLVMNNYNNNNNNDNTNLVEDASLLAEVKSSPSPLFEDAMSTTSTTTKVSSFSTASTTAQFGDVVSLKNKNSGDSTSGFLTADTDTSNGAVASSDGSVQIALDPSIAANKKRNLGVAILSVSLAIMNYGWQYLHPLEPIQILFSMEQASAPITAIGTTNKPTVVDFWAPWCENCKLLAPTLLQIEEKYGKDVNFVMINGDNPNAWPLIDAFGVDAIPHLALVEADGTVDTALIGPVPKQWIERDLDVLIANANLKNKLSSASSVTAVDNNNNGDGDAASTNNMNNQRQSLPYQMLDVFANRPDQRRIQVGLEKQ